MDQSNFERNYHDLVQISDEGADIFGSLLEQKFLDESCLDESVGCAVSVLKMQLEQESFYRWSEGWNMQNITDMQALSQVLHEAVCGYINGRLEGLRMEERRGALLIMLGGLEEADTEGWGECRQSIVARLPEERLVSMAASRIERHAGQLCVELEYDRMAAEVVKGTDGTAVHGSQSATAAALTLAAYEEYFELRCMPELLADASVAAAEIACAEKKEEGQAILTLSAYILLLAAALIAEPFLVTVGIATVKVMGKLLEKAAEQFQALMQFFSAGLRVSKGTAAADLLAELPTVLADFVPEEEENLLAAMGSADVENILEAEEEEEEEEEWEYDKECLW